MQCGAMIKIVAQSTYGQHFGHQFQQYPLPVGPGPQWNQLQIQNQPNYGNPGSMQMLPYMQPSNMQMQPSGNMQILPASSNSAANPDPANPGKALPHHIGGFGTDPLVFQGGRGRRQVRIQPVVDKAIADDESYAGAEVYGSD